MSSITPRVANGPKCSIPSCAAPSVVTTESGSAVVQLLLVTDVRERVPVRRCLRTHAERIVARGEVAAVAGERHVHRVRAQLGIDAFGHVDRVPLRPVPIERNRQREHAARREPRARRAARPRSSRGSAFRVGRRRPSVPSSRRVTRAVGVRASTARPHITGASRLRSGRAHRRTHRLHGVRRHRVPRAADRPRGRARGRRRRRLSVRRVRAALGCRRRRGRHHRRLSVATHFDDTARPERRDAHRERRREPAAAVAFEERRQRTFLFVRVGALHERR